MKKIMHRFLPFLLCMELIFTNIMPITIQAQASELPNVDQEELNIEPEVSQEISDEKNSGNGETTPGTTEDESGNEETEPGTTEDESGNEETEPGTTEDENGNEETEPGTTEDENRNEETEPGTTEDENGNEDTEPETTEDESVDEEPESGTTEDKSENEDEDTEAGATEEFIAEDALNSEDDIASGQYGNITWNIDAERKLTVNGTGDFCAANKKGVNRAPWYSYASRIKSAEISVTGMTDASYMFYDCGNLYKVDFSGSDTGSVTNMSHMFACSRSGYNYNNMDMKGLDTSNVTDMSYMFYRSGNVYEDEGSFATGNVTDMSYMFAWCESLTSVDVSGFDTSKIGSGRSNGMFIKCNCLKSLNLSNFIPERIEEMRIPEGVSIDTSESGTPTQKTPSPSSTPKPSTTTQPPASSTSKPSATEQPPVSSEPEPERPDQNPPPDSSESRPDRPDRPDKPQ